MYSAIFIAGAVGSLILYRAAAAVELMTLGASQAVLGLFAVLGLIVVDTAVDRVNWSATGAWVWMGAFAILFLTGLGMIWQARSFFKLKA